MSTDRRLRCTFNVQGAIEGDCELCAQSSSFLRVVCDDCLDDLKEGQQVTGDLLRIIIGLAIQTLRWPFPHEPDPSQDMVVGLVREWMKGAGVADPTVGG